MDMRGGFPHELNLRRCHAVGLVDEVADPPPLLDTTPVLLLCINTLLHQGPQLKRSADFQPAVLRFSRRTFSLGVMLLLRDCLCDGTQNGWQSFYRGELSFLDNVMRLRPRIGFAFLALALKFVAGGKYFHIEEIVTDKSNHFPVRVQSVFPKHRSGREPPAVPKFAQYEFDCLLLRRHIIPALLRAAGWACGAGRCST